MTQTPEKIDGDTDTARVLQRRSEATALRLQGLTWDQVAERCGYASRGAAYNAVIPHLRRVADETTADLRDLTNARLERVMVALWPKAISGDVKAAAEYRRYLADYRRHNGLDAPVQVQISSGAESRLRDVLADATALITGLVVDQDGHPVPPPTWETP